LASTRQAGYKTGLAAEPIICRSEKNVYNVKHCGQRRSFFTKSKTITIAARVDAQLDADLERLANATGRTKSRLITEALRSFVENEQQFLTAVEKGKKALRDGKVVDHDTVVAAFERLTNSRR
jgi:RHH-type rel operon transcriptional repressor/antitoxin RelB